MPDDQDHTPLKRADGITPPTTIGELITAEHTIRNLDDESRNDHGNALIVQDGYSYWLQSYPKDPQDIATCLRRFLLPFQRARKSRHRQLEGVHQSTSKSSMDARHEYSSSFRNQRYRGVKLCAQLKYSGCVNRWHADEQHRKNMQEHGNTVEDVLKCCSSDTT